MAGEPAGWTEEPVPEAAPVGWTEEPATESAAQWTEEPVPSTPAPGDVPAFGFTAEDISNEVKQAEAETQAEYDARLRKAFRDAQDQGGDDPAATARVATTLGLPFDQVRTNLNAFRATAAEAEFDPARWRKENPELARAIERNPELGRLVLRSKDTPVLVQLFRKASDYLHDSLGIMSDADIAEQEQLARMFNESPDDAMRFAEGIDQRARVRTELERTARDKPQKQLEVEDTQAAEVRAMAKTGNTEGPRSAGQVGASAVAYAARVLWERGGEARKRLELSGLQMRVMLAENGITTKDDPRDVADLQAELADARAAMVPRAYGDDTGVLRNLSAGVEGAVSTVVGLKEGAKGAGVVGTVGAAVAGGAALVATRNPAVAGEAALFGARVGGQKGFQAGFLVSTFQMETASSYEALRESETDKGERLTPAEAMGGALVQGAIKTGFEYVSFGAATKGLKGALPETITGLIRRDPTFRALLRQLATEYGKSSLVEGGTEMLQDLVEQIGDYVQLSLHDQALQKGPVVRPERTLEAGQAGLVGALMTGAAMNSVAALTTRIDEGRAELADKQIAPLLALAQDENVQAAPAELAKVVADISLEQGHKPLASIHVDPAAIFTYFQQQGLNDDQAEAMLDEATGRKGSVEEAAAAAANGTKLEVPVQAVLSTWGRSEIGQALAQDTTTDPNGITQRQRQQQKQELDARTKAVLEQEQAKFEDAEHVAQMVEQYAQSIVESGRSATEARKASALLRTFIETALAEAPGRRAVEVFPDLPLQFHVGDEYRTTQQELEPGLLEPSTEAEKAAVLTPGAEVSPESAAAALTDEQRAQKLYVDEISGLNTRRAWDETPRTPGTQVGVLTLPPIKAINDSPRGAHDVSNRLLRTVGGLLGKLVRPGRLAVRSGTDFLVETDGQAEMETLAAQIQQQLPQGLEVLGFSGPNVEAVYETEKSVTKARRELPAEHPQHLPARGKTRFDTESLTFESFPGAAAEGRRVPAGVKPPSLERFATEALYDRQMPGVYSKLGFDLAPRRKFTASIDMRGLKLINELAEKLELGKTLGDEVLRQFSEAAKRAGGGLLYFAHLSGDEFAAKSNNRDELEAFVEAFQAELQRVSVPVTLKSGKKVNLTPAFRHGIGSTYGLADQDLNTRKAAEQPASPQGSPDADLRAVGILRDGSGVDRPAGADAADPALARGAEEVGRDSRANGAAPEGDAGNRRRGDGGAPAAEVATPKFPGFAEERARLQAKQRELESLAADDAPQTFPLKGGGSVVVARDPSKPGAWRATFIDGETDEPTGHMEAPDKLGALEAARGSGAIIEGVSADAAPEPGSDIGEENVEPLTAEEQALEAAITRRLEGREARAEEEALMRAGFNTDEDIALAREALARFRAVVEKTDKPESAERAARRRKAAERVRDERKRLAEAWLKWIEGSGPPLVETGTAYAPKGAIKVEAERLKDIVAWGRKLGLLDPQSGFSAFIEEQNRLQGIKPIRVRRKKGVFRGVGTTEDLRAAFVKNVLGRLAQADTQTALATIGAFQDEILSALPEGTADSFAPDSNRRMTHAEETWAEARVAIAHARWALRDLARAARAGTPASTAQRSLFAARNALEVAGQSEHVTRLMLQGKGRQEALDALWESPGPERLAIAKASKAFGPMLQDIEDRLNGKEGRRVLFQLPTEEESRARLQEHLVLLDALREAGAQAVATPAQWASLIASFEFHLRTRWRLREGGEQAVADALRDAISTTFGRYLKSGDSTSGATRAKKAGLTPDLRRELLRHGKAYLSSGLRMGDAQGLPMHGLRQSEQVARELSGELQLDRPEGRSGGSRTYGAPLSNLRELWDGGRVREGSLYPADVYGPQGRRIYGDPGTPGDAETWRIIAAVKGRPDAEVEVWATRGPTESQQIEPGDLVTLSREHAASRIIDERGEQLVSAKVRAGDLFADGNFMLEWGYDPKMPEGKAPIEEAQLNAINKSPTRLFQEDSKLTPNEELKQRVEVPLREFLMTQGIPVDGPDPRDVEAWLAKDDNAFLALPRGDRWVPVLADGLPLEDVSITVAADGTTSERNRSEYRTQAEAKAAAKAAGARQTEASLANVVANWGRETLEKVLPKALHREGNTHRFFPERVTFAPSLLTPDVDVRLSSGAGNTFEGRGLQLAAVLQLLPGVPDGLRRDVEQYRELLREEKEWEVAVENWLPARTRSLKARDVKPGMYVAGRDGAFRKVLAVDRPEPGLYEMDLEGGGTREAWGEVLVAAEGEKPPAPPAQRQLGKRWYQDDTASQPGAPKWYSQVERTVVAARQAKNTGAAWWALLSKSPGVKKEELALMGVEDFLRGRSSVTKDELLKFAQDNAVVLKEVTREPISQRAIDDIASFSAGLADAIERARTALLEGNGDTLEEQPRLLAYRALDSLADALNEVSPLEDESLSVLAGGSRNGYGAMWLNLDSSLQEARNALDDLRTGLAPLPPDLPLPLRVDPELSPELVWVDEARTQIFDAMRALESIEAATRDQGERPDVTSFNEYVVGGESAPAEVKASYREITFQHPGAEGWRNPHFEGPVIAHARTTLRRLESGKRALMVEEVQSDLHQAGRTGGYRGEVSEDDAFARQFEEPIRKHLMTEGVPENGPDPRAVQAWLDQGDNAFMAFETERGRWAPLASSGFPDRDFIFATEAEAKAEAKRQRLVQTETSLRKFRAHYGSRADEVLPKELHHEGNKHAFVPEHVLFEDSAGEARVFLSSGMGTDFQSRSLRLNEVLRLMPHETAARLRPDITRYERILTSERGETQRPPRAPWSTTWEELVAKRMVTLALENGLTDIAWTTGLEQADRYAEEDTVRWNRIKGGMIAAYDERLPRVFERILAPWKLKAREGRLSTGETVWHVDISGAAMDVVSRGGMPLFQENEGDAPAAAPAPKGPRGYTKVDPNRKLRSTIDVFLNRHANFSTVVHESAHAFLEMLLDQAEAPEASDRAKAKGKMALEALGVTDRAEITDKHHERFARAYEGWLFEGKQVARGVQRAFRAFSSWLTRIYRSLRSIPDFDPADLERLRPVFDAMHATERELAAARRAQGPRTALTEEQRLEEEDDYAEATYATQLRAMKDALRVHEQWWKTALQKLRVTFREEYEDLPARRAQRILSGEGTRGDGVVLNEAQVRAVIGDARVVGMRTSETGVAPSVVAEQAGFRNATEMLGALAALPTRDRWVEQQATAAMEQAHPGLSQRIEEFRKAIQGGLHKATERRLLREWAGLPAQAIQQAAAQQVLNRTIDPRRLRPAAALAAMRRAAAEKARAAAVGDIKTAGDAARIEMMNHYLHRELLKAEEERERMLGLAKRLAREDSRGKAGKADPAYRDGIDFVLGAFGLADARPDVGADDLQQAVAQLNGDAVVVGDPDWLAPVLQALGRVDRWEDLNVGEMRAVSDALKMLDAGARARRTVLLEDGRHDYETIRDEMLKEIGSTLASQGPVIPKNVRNAAERLWSLANEADAFLTNPIDLVRDLTGDKPDTWLHRVFVNNMRRAQSLETQLLEDVISPILKSLEEMPKKVRKRLAEPVDGRALFPEHRKDLEPPRRRWELLALALNLGNESSREVTLRGRSITLEQATAALQDLTAEEISWINTVHQALEKLREPSFALEERETGLAPEAVTAVPLKLANGELTGGYFPLKAEPGVSRVSRLQAAEDALASLLDPSYTRPVTRHGHLKARTGAVYAVTFDLDVIRRHLLQSAHDIAFREAVKTAGRFTMDEKVQAALTEYLGAEKAPVFLKWLKDIGGGTGYQATIADRLLSHLKGNLAGAALSGLSTALGNFANLAAAITSTPLTARSLAKGIARWRPSRAGEVRELSGVFRTMQSSALRRLNEELHAAEGLRSPKLAWLREASFAALRGVDAIVSTSVWDGAHKQALEQGMDEAAAVRWADDLLLRVQPSQSIVEKAGILRDKGWAGSLATFYSYLSVAYRAQHRLLAPVFERAFRNASPAQRAVILGKMAGRLLAFYVAFQVLGELGMGRGADDGDRDKDDPENKLKQWRNWFIRKTLGAPLSLIPLVPASSMFDSAVLGKPTMSTRNDPVTGATLQLAKAGTTLWSAANGEAEPEKATREAFRAVGLLTGAPERLISTTGGYAVDLATGAKEPRGALRTTSGLLYGERDNQPENFLTLTDDIIEALLSDW